MLQKAGCAAELPREHVCCGRPYYDFGMLDRAKARSRACGRPGTTARARIAGRGARTPGCLSVFRDELHQLFQGEARAAQLARNVCSLAELLNARQFTAPVRRKVLLHGHCHQKALWGNGADLELLERCQAEVSAPDTGCCGMAGSFGYRPEFYETSKKIAALALLPALEAEPHAAVLASGFSCREQIEALAGRRTVHLAELLAGA